MKLDFKDVNGKEIETGHILAVRYVWNSYVGVAKQSGLCAESPDIKFAFFSPHSWDKSATYQIIGHDDKNHPDYNNDVYLWYYHGYSPDECPATLIIYQTQHSQ